jgi:hypothetical protein
MYQSGNKQQEEMTAIPSKYPQGFFKDKPCRLCGTVFSPLAPSHLYCKQECADEAFTRNHLRKTYNLSLEQFHYIYEKQNGLCAICKKEGFQLSTHQKFKIVVDHCHTTGVVRGMLCHNCNRALGLFQDNVESLKTAIDYLEGATTIPIGEYIPSNREWKRTTRNRKKRDDIVCSA